MKRVIVSLLVVVVLLVAANDAWRYFSATRNLKDATYELARWAGENFETVSRDEAAQQLAVMGRARGVTVYQYGQDQRGIEIWTETEVSGLIVAGTVINLIDGQPLATATEAPVMIRDYRRAGVK